MRMSLVSVGLAPFTIPLSPPPEGVDALGDHLSGLAKHALAPGPLGYAAAAGAGDDEAERGAVGALDAAGSAAGLGRAGRMALRAHGRLPPCSCLALSGLPAREQLFNGSLCDGKGHFKDLLDRPDHIGEERRREDGHSGGGGGGKPHGGRRVSVLAAAPVVVPRLGPTVASRQAASARASGRSAGPGGRSAGRAHGLHRADGRPLQFDAVFAVSTGVASSYGPDGRLNWQTYDAPSWSEGNGGWLLRLPTPQAPDDGGGGGRRRSGGGGSGAEELSLELLVAGESRLAVLSALTGEVLAEAGVPEPPRRRPILGDFDDDGASEVLLVSDGAVWGYTVAFTPGTGTGGLALVVGLVVLSMIATYAMHLEVEPPATSGSGGGGGGEGARRHQPRHDNYAAHGERDKGGSARQRPVARLPRSMD